MTIWTLSTREKKNTEMIQIWVKADETICLREWYRWGSWILRADAPPEIDLQNEQGYDLYGSGVDWEMVDMSDGVAVHWEWPDTMSVQDREQFEQLYEDEGVDGVSALGWHHVDTEIHLHGPLELT